MSESGEDYGNMISIMSNVQQMLSIFAGFVVTILTLLITLLPNPSDILAQITLFSLTLIFDLLVFLTAWNSANLRKFSKVLPGIHTPQTFDVLVLLTIGSCGVPLTLMFLLINLTYVALASGITWIIMSLFSLIIIWKPYRQYMRSLNSQ